MNRIVPSLAVIVFAACGQGAPEQLDGSLTAVVDVTYDRATLEARDGFITLRFQQKRGTAEDTVLKVGVIIDGKVPNHSIQYDLAEMMAGGGQRGAATRNVLADPDHTVFPPLSRGSIRVDGDLTTDTHVRGEVSLTFVQLVADKSSLGSGRAVFGPFEAEVMR
jgi:hypothetical protein